MTSIVKLKEDEKQTQSYLTCHTENMSKMALATYHSFGSVGITRSLALMRSTAAAFLSSKLSNENWHIIILEEWLQIMTFKSAMQ